jgi:hypothetical protein
MGEVRPCLAQDDELEKHEDQACQEHQHRNLIDGVHGAQVEIGMTVGIFLTEEIAKHGAEIKQTFGTHRTRNERRLNKRR